MGDVTRLEVDADASIHDVPLSQPTQPAPAAAAAVAEQKKRGRKRKRLSPDASSQASAFGFDRKEALADTWRREVDDLVRYFREELVPKASVGGVGEGTIQMLVARLMEGSGLPLPKLCVEIYAGLQTREGVTLASLAADVQFVGSRVRYGVDNGRLDVADDEDEACLWCWEARDAKLFPKTQRPVLKALREARKKVHDRICALSAGISAVLNSGNQDDYATELRKAVQRIGQELGVADIRSMVEKSMLKNSANLMEKEAKLREKQTVKEAEKVEKEKLRAELHLQKEKARNEKEQKKQKVEAEKEEKKREKEEKKQREKEESESQKQLKRQQDDGERKRKLREKQENELKNKLSLKKQANMMEMFLKNKCSIMKSDNTETAAKPATVTQDAETVHALVTNIDQMFNQDVFVTIEDIEKNQLGRWKRLCYSGRKNRWGVRLMPKLDVVKEIRLQGQLTLSKPLVNQGHDSGTQTMLTDSSYDKTANGADVIVIDDDVSGSDVAEVVHLRTELPFRVKKLLQFDKSHRPAYYGTWSKRSAVVGSRKPLNKDPTVDYDVDSDEEWEEEEPGESLTDCEKDDPDETEEAEAICADDSEDSFVVPDGYLSESERGDVDSPDSSNVNGDAESSISCTTDAESEDLRLLRQHQKYLGGLIEKALRRSQPLIISNLMHKSEFGAVGDLSGITKIEQICLLALTMQVCTGVSSIELPSGDLDVNELICEVPSQSSVPASVPTMDDSVLADIIATIRSCPGGINKVVDTLHQKFPAFSRTYMKNKVKEIADYNFVESQWKIKREVTELLGLSPERIKKPAERIKKTKGITAFFSKRCLPPSEAKEVTEISPLQLKSQNFSRDAVVACELNQQRYAAEDK